MSGSRKVLGSVLILSLPAAIASAQSLPQVSQVRAILHEAGKLVPKMEDSQQSSAASNIAGQQARAGDLAGALETIRSVAKREAGSYYGLGWALAAAGEWRSALDLIRDLPEDNLKALDYLGIAEPLARSGDFEHALAVARKIAAIPKTETRFADVLVEVAIQQLKAGDGKAGMAMIEEASNSVDSPAWCAGAIDRLAHAGYPEAALPLLEKLQAAARQKPDLLRNLAA